MLGLSALALIVIISLVLVGSKHTPTFRPDDDCLIYERGILDSTRDVISSLLGVITPCQMPIIGPWLDVGTVNLDVVAHRVHVLQITNFDAFRGRNQAGALQHQVASGWPIQILFQSPNALPDLEWLPRLISEPDA